MICTLGSKSRQMVKRNFKKDLKISNVWHFICLPLQQQGNLLEISYILLFSIMTLHYHRPYQISSLEAEAYKI